MRGYEKMHATVRIDSVNQVSSIGVPVYSG